MYFIEFGVKLDNGHIAGLLTEAACGRLFSGEVAGDHFVEFQHALFDPSIDRPSFKLFVTLSLKNVTQNAEQRSFPELPQLQLPGRTRDLLRPQRPLSFPR